MIGRPSIAVRASLIFISIYVATMCGLVALLAVVVMSGAAGNRPGPDIAIELAKAELSESQPLTFKPSGRFASLARKNPSLWLLAERGEARISFGKVPPAAAALYEQLRGTVSTGELMIPGAPSLLAEASFERFDEEDGKPVQIFAGGVAPASIGLGEALSYYVTAGMGAIILVFVAAGVLSTLISLPFLAAPIRPTVRAAAAIAADSPNMRLPSTRVPREIVPLVQAINDLLDRLSTELGRRRRLIADMAHELRTPLAVLKLRLDDLRDDAHRTDLQRIVTRLSHMVAQMLDVERLSLVDQKRELLDLRIIAREVVVEMAPMAIATGYELGLDAPDRPVEIAGDVLALQRAIANLVTNSIAHAGGSGQINICVGFDRTVTVSDQGPGVNKALRADLFEAFRSGHQDRDGCGLGLHLVREIMRAHGGNARLVDSPQGATFILEFPGAIEPSVVPATPTRQS